MNIGKYLSLRIQRGFKLSRIGANEARVLFDLCVGFGALIGALLFSKFFVTASYDQVRWTVWLLPLALVALNLAGGIYTRLRSASGETKTVALTASVVVGALLAIPFVPPAIIYLWVGLGYGPLVLSRLLLNIQYSKRRPLIEGTLNEHGPVLVLGGAGYIGSHVVDLLLQRGYRVRVLDRLMYGKETLKDFEHHPRYEFVEGDAADLGRLTFAMRNAAAVVHLAGLVGDPACAVDDQFTRHTNIIITRMVKEVAQSVGVRRFVFASSCSVYGFTESEVNETDALNPVSLYAQTKIDSEKELLANNGDNFFVTVLRFATVFGHSRRQRYDLVANLFTAQAVTDGRITVVGPEQWRPFIHVRDLARAIFMVLDADPLVVQGQIFNIGDELLNMTILQLAQRVQYAVGRGIEIAVQDGTGDPRNYTVSFRKIRNALGFRSSISIEDGVKEIAEALRQSDADYKRAVYSNLEMTREALVKFRDPAEAAHLYGPLNAP